MPTKKQLEAARGGTLPDLLPEPLHLLVVGINPSLWSAAVGSHFSRPGNRFWPALHRAGIVERPIDAAEGYSADDLRYLRRRGLGIMSLVQRATARADELGADELRAGRERVEETVRSMRPQAVAVLGLGAYRTAFAEPKARAGLQDHGIAGAPTYLLPNPSGLNAHETVASLAAAYAEAGRAAGLGA